MSEATIEIRTPDGVADGYVYRPANAASALPGVLLLTDLGGIRDSNRKLCSDLAERGYVVLLPNAFYRTGRPPLFDFRPDFTEPRTLKRFGELAGPLVPDAVERDAAAYLNFLSAQSGVRPGPLAVVGYCFTGSVALRIAAAQPERVALAASFHGGGLYTDAATSPHLVLPKIKARLYFGHATQDRSMSVEAIERLDRALAEWGGRYESEVYEGARHGWTLPDSPVFHEAQAARAHAKLATLLAETF